MAAILFIEKFLSMAWYDDFGSILSKIGDKVIGVISEGFSALKEGLFNAVDFEIANSVDLVLSKLTPYVEALKFTEAIKDWMDLNTEIYATGRNMGMIADNMDAVTRNLSQASADLSLFYSTDPKKMLQSMNEVAEATGRVRMMTKDEMEQLAYMEQFGGKKLVGAFDAIGGSVNVASARFVQLQQNAGALGLNLNKATETLAKNVGKLNSLTFREGVTGMERMVLLSQQMKINFDAIENVVSKFEKVEDAIANSAKLNMLGGSFAAEFSNPLEMMYYANYDAEGLVEKMNASLGNMGVFNRDTGVVELSPLDKQRIKAMAEATGMDKNSALETANRKALARAMESEIDSSLSQTEKDMITNRASWNARTNSFEVRMQDGSVRDIASLRSGDISSMVSDHVEDATVDIRDNVRNIAQMLQERMRDKSSRSMSWKDVTNAISGYATRKHFDTMNRFFGGASGGGAGWIDYFKDNKTQSNIQTAVMMMDHYGGPDGIAKRALIENGSNEAYNIIKTIGKWEVFGKTALSYLEHKAGREPYVMQNRQYDSSEDLKQNYYGIPSKVTRPLDGSYSYTSPNRPMTFYQPHDYLHERVVPFPVYNERPNAPVPPIADATKSPIAQRAVNPLDLSRIQSGSNPSVPVSFASMQTPAAAAAATPQFTELAKARANMMTEEQANDLFKKIQEGQNVDRDSVEALQAYAFMRSGQEANPIIDGHRSDMAYYMANNKGDSKKAQTEYAREVTAFAQEVEGFVDIRDPELQNKAFLSVVKIHELLVAKYGSMSVIQRGAEIKSQNQNLKGQNVNPTYLASNNNLSVRANTSRTPVKSEMTVNFVVSGDLSLNGEKVGLSKDDIKRIVTSTDVVDAVMTKAQQLKGTQGSNIFETATWM